MPTILDRIVETKREEVARAKNETPLSDLEEKARRMPVPLNLSGALWGGERIRVMAEIKRASPSRGPIRPDLDAATQASIYANNGAAAISVLTEGPNYQGSLDDLGIVREAITQMPIPIMRKDFIFDPYQVVESRAAGADGILLIVGILELSQLQELLHAAQELWLQSLVEVFNETELETALKANAELIGINNRNLHTFETSLGVTESLRPMIPKGKIVVSESGVSSSEDIKRLHKIGIDAVLVGESLVMSTDPGSKLRELA